MALHVRCDCGKVLKVPEKSAGKQGKCPSCGRIVIVPAPARSSEVPRCPSCGGEMQTDALVCIRCGFDRRVGKRVEPVDLAAAGTAEDEGQVPQTQPPRRFWQSTVFRVCAGGAFLVFVAVLAAWRFSAQADHDAFSRAKENARLSSNRSEQAAAYESYVAKYPSGRHAEEARRERDALVAAQAATAAAAPPRTADTPALKKEAGGGAVTKAPEKPVESAPKETENHGEEEAVPATVKALMALVAQPTGNSRGGANFDLFMARAGHNADIMIAVQRVIDDHNEARAMALLARLVAEKQGSSENDDKLVYSNALFALTCFSITDQDFAKAWQALQKHCDPRIAQKAIAELDARYRKRKEIYKKD